MSGKHCVNYPNKLQYSFNFNCQKCCKAKAEAPKQVVNVEDCKEAGKTRTQLAVVQPAEPPKLPVLPSPVKLPITPVETDRPLPPTPPLMQIVVINGRKYIAISATAPDN